MNKKLEAKDVLTPWEEFLQKKREKKKQKKCESEQVRAWLADAKGVFVGWNVPAFVSSSILTSLDVESTMLRCESCCFYFDMSDQFPESVLENRTSAVRRVRLTLQARQIICDQL